MIKFNDCGDSQTCADYLTNTLLPNVNYNSSMYRIFSSNLMAFSFGLGNYSVAPYYAPKGSMIHLWSSSYSYYAYTYTSETGQLAINKNSTYSEYKKMPSGSLYYNTRLNSVSNYSVYFRVIVQAFNYTGKIFQRI